MAGSSPLARGLLTDDVRPGEIGRIIPARAGFTSTENLAQKIAADHPRSRGVYDLLSKFSAGTSGSSPLARGLQEIANTRFGKFRIIPARAGFTWGSGLVRRMCPDHPRSRGVYSCLFTAFFSANGSSPLARGLRPMRSQNSLTSRIIPARAGFTIAGYYDGAKVKDHPRSRGVYLTLSMCSVGSRGSSPLARGLLSQDDERFGRPRIIPARAGFTHVYSRRFSVRTDHPRSRGVYVGAQSCAAADAGSSPLARGLPVETWDEGGESGIIPARAGFTPCCARSSGVASGSSPLARGLQLGVGHATSSLGIIPARAGFT